MRMGKLVAVVAMLACASGAQAVVNIETVPVGNLGNAPDTEVMSDGTTGYGSVSYDYNIGKYEVTAGQYTEFLNKVAKTDTYGLYNRNMDVTVYRDGCNIKRSGSSGSYEYSVASDWANRPVNWVNFWDACRFANWLHNGQPTGAQGPGTTETGAYTLTTDGMNNNTVVRNTGWKWAVTSEDEWYKAAYYKGGSTNAGYFDYPTSSDGVPSNDLIDPDPGNNSTYYISGDDYTIGSPYWRTDVGAHENSDSQYGTFDQGGNVWEWNEAVIYSARGLRGGGFYSWEHYLRASNRDILSARNEVGDVGFRVAEVPEPASILMLALGGLALLRRRAR